MPWADDVGDNASAVESESPAKIRRDGNKHLSGNIDKDSEHLVSKVLTNPLDLESLSRSIVELASESADARESLRNAGIIDAVRDILENGNSHELGRYQAQVEASAFHILGSLCSNFASVFLVPDPEDVGLGSTSSNSREEALYTDEVSQYAIRENTNLLRLFKDGVSNPKADVAASAAGALCCVVYQNLHLQNTVARMKIFKALVELLQNFDTSCQLAAAATIRCLCVNPSNAKIAVAKGVVPHLVNHVSSYDLAVQTHAAQALWILALSDKYKTLLLGSESSDEQRQAEAPQEGQTPQSVIPGLISMVMSRSSRCQAASLGCLRSLSCLPIAKKTIMNEGIVGQICSILEKGDKQTKLNALGLLSNLASSPANRQHLCSDPKVNVAQAVEEVAENPALDQVVRHRASLLHRLLTDN